MTTNELSVTQPTEKKRLAIYKEMSPACQQVATDFAAKLGKGASGVIGIMYDIGARMATVMDDEGQYGTNAAQQLADFCGLGKATRLYNLRTFADSFEKEYVRDQSAKQLSNGEYLELGHWLQMMKLDDAKAQSRFLGRVFKEGLSVNDLEREIRALDKGDKKNTRSGGRKPAKPSSMLAGLQKTFSIAQQFNRYEDTLKTHVFDKIKEMPADAINPTLLDKLTQVRTTVDETLSASEDALKQIDASIERVKKVLDRKAAAPAAETNGEAKAAKPSTGKKKKKKKKPVAAAVGG